MVVIAACVALVLIGVAIVLRSSVPGSLSPCRCGVSWEPHSRLGSWPAFLPRAGGRLVMRLLAITSADVEGSLTEAGETVGEITIGGTLAFIIFTGLAAGLLSAVLYALVRPLLPPGRVSGPILGALLLVLVGSRVDPLRSDNFDFALVGPDWLAVLSFSVLAIFHGTLVVALASRWGSPPGGVRAVRYVGRIARRRRVAALPSFVGAVGTSSRPRRASSSGRRRPGSRPRSRAPCAPRRGRP